MEDVTRRQANVSLMRCTILLPTPLDATPIAPLTARVTKTAGALGALAYACSKKGNHVV